MRSRLLRCRLLRVFALTTVLPGVVLLGVIGCATVPRPTVELSEVVDRQIGEMQKSHEAFVSLYYAKLKEDVNRFVEEKWTPTFLDQTLAGETDMSRRLLQELDSSYKLIHLDPSAVTVTVDGSRVTDPETRAVIEAGVAQAVREQRARFGQTMLRYSRGAQREINKQRAAMLAPIEEQEALVLAELRGGYTDLLRASTTIRGYLSSLVQVTQERDQILDKLGLLEKQRRLVDAAVEANDKTVAVLAKAEDAGKALADFQERMRGAKDKLNEIRSHYDAIRQRPRD